MTMDAAIKDSPAAEQVTDWEKEEQELGLYVPFWLQIIRKMRKESPGG